MLAHSALRQLAPARTGILGHSLDNGEAPLSLSRQKRFAVGTAQRRQRRGVTLLALQKA